MQFFDSTRTTRRRAVRRAIPFAIVLACPSALRAQAAAPAEAPAPARFVDQPAGVRALAQQLLDSAGLPGLSVAIGVDGQIVFSEGFGYADLEQRVPVTPLTRMRIGSVSKPVTAAALGLLLEEGRLDLDAPIQQYVPTFPQKRWPITVRQVAGHTAGIRHYLGDENGSSRRYATVLDGLTIFQDDTLLFEPGTQYSYSSYGWNLLSAVVEGASGESFLMYMRRSVFEPLGMRSVVAEHTDSIIPWRASFYERQNGRLLNAAYVDNSYKWAGGGFISNTEDLVRFGWAHIRAAFLKPETLEVLVASHRLRSGEPTNYGIGWSSSLDPQGRRVVGHTGGSVGGRAVLVLYPDHGVVVALLSNAGHAPMSFANAHRFAALYLAANAR
jgi:serine beta-lactamase-like protein LACTB